MEECMCINREHCTNTQSAILIISSVTHTHTVYPLLQVSPESEGVHSSQMSSHNMN